jgi:hypothetical protein
MRQTLSGASIPFAPTLRLGQLQASTEYPGGTLATNDERQRQRLVPARHLPLRRGALPKPRFVNRETARPERPQTLDRRCGGYPLGVWLRRGARLSRKGQASFSRSRAEAGARLPMQVQAPGSGAGLLRLLTSGTVTSRCCNDGWKQESTARPRLAARCCPKHPRALGPMWSSLGVWSGCVCRNVHVLRAGTRGRAAAPRTHPFRVEGGNWR